MRWAALLLSVLGAAQDAGCAVTPGSSTNVDIRCCGVTSKDTLTGVLGPLVERKVTALNFQAGNTALDTPELREVSDRIAEITTLTDLTIEVEGNTVTDDGVGALAAAIQTLPNLRQLTLRLGLDNATTPVGDIAAQALGRALAATKSLEALRINLGHSKIGDVGFQQLINGVVALPLVSLELTLGDTVISDGSEELLGSLGKLTSLKKFVLRLGESGVDDVGMRALGGAIGRMMELVELKLRLDCDSDDGRRWEQDFAVGLQNLSKLKELVLQFDRNNDSVRYDVEPIITQAATLRELTVLSLWMRGPSVPYTAEKKAGVLGNLINLRKLTLGLPYKFFGCDGDAGVESLGKMTQLTHLHLDFAVPGDSSPVMCQSTALTTVVNGVVGLQNLKELRLMVDGHNLENAGADNVGRLMGAMPQLKVLELGMSTTWMEDKDLQHVSAGMPKLTNLKQFYMHFGEVHRISDTGLQALADGLASLKSVQDLDFRLIGIHDKGLTMLTNALTKLDQVQELHLALKGEHCGEEATQMAEVVGQMPKLDKLVVSFEAPCTDTAALRQKMNSGKLTYFEFIDNDQEVHVVKGEWKCNADAWINDESFPNRRCMGMTPDFGTCKVIADPNERPKDETDPTTNPNPPGKGGSGLLFVALFMVLGAVGAFVYATQQAKQAPPVGAAAETLVEMQDVAVAGGREP